MLQWLMQALQVPVSSILSYGLVSVVLAVGLVYVLAHYVLAPRLVVGKETHVVITGGSAGIGLAVAKEYVRMGAGEVTIVARNSKTLADAAQELRGISESCTIRTVSVDCGSSENFVRMAFVNSQVPDCDILVNCAGTSVAGAFEDLANEAFEHMLRVNVLGSVYPTRVLLPGMKRRARGAGRIVFVASQVAQCALHGYTAYAASKWALRGLAEALQMEVKPFGILVSVVYPPDTDTPGYKVEMQTKPSLTAKLSAVSSVFQPAEVAKDIVGGSALGYFGISTGLDGWMLKQLHPGMSPVHNPWEVLQQVLFGPLCRVISVFYLLWFDQVCAQECDEGLAGFRTVSEQEAKLQSSGSQEKLSAASAAASNAASAAATSTSSERPGLTKRASISTDR